MKNSEVSIHAGAVVMLTVEGRFALASHALTDAAKTRSREERKRLCEQVISQLRVIVQS